MIVVMQCAARKQPGAGSMRTQDGRRVCFVADPAQAPDGEVIYARPDDPSDTGPTWREVLRRYNDGDGANPLGLLPAYALYREGVYQRLAERVGLERLYILSAGWGLIGATYLTPYYDITFAAQADSWKRRRKSHAYLDFRMLPASSSEPVLFFGSSEYVPLFAALTAGIKAPRALFSRSQRALDLAGISVVKFDTPRRTNWQYDCVNAFLSGRLDLPFNVVASVGR
jgi:hypothetical protein